MILDWGFEIKLWARDYIIGTVLNVPPTNEHILITNPLPQAGVYLKQIFQDVSIWWSLAYLDHYLEHFRHQKKEGITA